MDTFYDTKNLTLDKKTTLLNDCMAVACKWWVDILDCNKSFARQKIEMSYEEILFKLTNKSHFVVIDRKKFCIAKRKKTK